MPQAHGDFGFSRIEPAQSLFAYFIVAVMIAGSTAALMLAIGVDLSGGRF